MKLTSLNSASVLIEDKNIKVLCDPWLTGQEYLNSWGIYPTFQFKPKIFDDVDFIYISHDHPDHSSDATLSQLNKKIPTLIHNFPEKYLKIRLENLGFQVIELEHNRKTRLKDDLQINILAADNCDPKICGKIMGCGLLETKFGTTQIDTMSVIDNGKEVIVNTNDCPFPISAKTAMIVKEQYKTINLLLMGYVSASSYPQCFDLDQKEKQNEAYNKKQKHLALNANYVDILKPKYVIPFAGRYTLTGKNAHLNYFRGEPELEEAYEYLTTRFPQDKHKCIIMNPNSFFDVTTGTTSDVYVPIDQKKKQEYIEKVFANVKFQYENESIPSTNDILALLPQCYENFEKYRKKINWKSETSILIKIKDNIVVAISINGEGFKIIKNDGIPKFEPYLMISSDIRLLYWLLQGRVHWAIADIGSHLRFKRVPNNYERALYWCLNRFTTDISTGILAEISH